LAASFTLPVLVFDFPQNLYTIHAVEGVRLFCTFSLLPIAILGGATHFNDAAVAASRNRSGWRIPTGPAIRVRPAPLWQPPSFAALSLYGNGARP
jgi:hypothetical protein